MRFNVYFGIQTYYLENWIILKKIIKLNGGGNEVDKRFMFYYIILCFSSGCSSFLRHVQRHAD